MAPSNPEFPRRLADGSDRTAVLLQRALAEPAPGPTEQRSWQRLSQRSQRSVPRWALPAVALGLSACALVAWLARPSPELALSPEVWSQPHPPVRKAEPAPTEAKPANATPTLPEHSKAASRVTPEADTKACERLAKDGQYAVAAACYGRISRGSSMAAELALYEKARIEAKALGNAALALTTLDEHARRFPGGVLTTEVGLTRIELLNQLGRRDDALRAIERGMQGRLGSERGGDLQLMRAEILVALGNCPLALEALRAAKQAGVHPSRLEATERRCPAPASPSATEEP